MSLRHEQCQDLPAGGLGPPHPGLRPHRAPPTALAALPEEDQVLFLLMIAKKMYQLVKFLICLTNLQCKGKN